MLRSLFSRALLITLTICSSTGIVQATDVLLSHQGRLLDSGDQPITGSRTITFRLYESALGGAPLWTEVHNGVQISDGLFDVILGSVVALSTDILAPSGSSPERWLSLRIEPDTEELSPRRRLTSTPSSAVSTRVTGDIVTGLGSLAIADLNSDGRIDMVASPESTYTAWVQDNSPNTEHFARLKVMDASSQLNLNHPDASSTMLANSAGGGIRLGGMSGSTTGTIRMAATPDSAASSMDSDSDGDGIPESSVKVKSSGPRATGSLSGMSGSTTGTIRMVASPDSTTDVLDSDSDGDGIPESSLKNKSTPSGSSSVLHGMSGSTTGTIRMAVSPDSASSSIECDADNDGIPESSAKLKALVAGTTSIIGSRGGSTTGTIRMATSPDSASSSLEWDSDNDGVPDCSSKQKGSSTGISHALIGGHSGSTTGTIRMGASGGGGPVLPSSSIDLETDIDGDGIMENTCRSGFAGAIAGVVVSSRFGSGPRQTTSMDGSFSHSHLRCDSDTDGDGVQDNSVISESSVSGASLRVISLNGLPPGVPVEDNIALNADGSSSSVALKKGVAQVGLSSVGAIGIPGGAVLSSRCISSNGMDTASTEQSSDGSGAALKAINTKGSGATLRVSATADDSGSVGTDCDDDANGFSERATWTSSRPYRAISVVAADLDDDGDFDNTVMQSSDSASSQSECSSVTGSGSGAKSASLSVMASPGGSACRAINTKGNGQTVRSTMGATDADAAHCLLEVDNDSDGTLETSISQICDSASAQVTVSAKVGAYQGRVTVLKGIARMAQMTSDGDGYFDGHLGIGVDATHRIDVTGGAYCDGTNWVNASDRNSKENFKKIDGEKLLGKIADLEITQWNYKNDKSTAHIGPTAQDFKEKFGVGSDGKSISTIDPSGIALAAIKELYKQFSDEMKQKDAQIEQLQEEMKKLRQELQKKN